MCGIAGVVSLAGHAIEPGTAARMRDAIQHRGPDGNGEFEAPGVQLAACRLAIVDLAPRGIMPMTSPDGRYTIVHNGEIYNRLELRDDLLRQGADLRTTTDTEVILALYARHGPAMLDALDGMFAFAIWDATERALFAARDRVGEKPFYHAEHNARLYFASEPKALFAAGMARDFAQETWPELLTFRSVAGERTPYRGVRQLLAGYWLQVRNGQLRLQRWWKFPTTDSEPDRTIGGPFAATDFSALLEGSVRRRLIADVPVGTLLSGGLDSSAVTALAARAADKRLHAFTVRFDGTFADEGAYAEAAARHIGVEHHQVRVPRAEMPQLVADMAWHLDEPMAFMATAEILAVSRYARRHVEVLLTGETADELFGGYTRMRLLRYPRLVGIAGRALRPFRHRLRLGSRWQRAASSTTVSRAEWIAASYADGDPRRFSAAPLREWAPFRARVAEEAVAEHRDPVIAALAYERLTHLPPILMTGDRMTMGAGIEARLPFTDPRLLDFAGRATKEQLFSGPHGKQPLRAAMADTLPAITVNRRKRGWTSPYRIYLREIPELRTWLTRMPDHPIVASSPVGPARARATVDEFLAGDDARYHDAWMLGRIVLWHQVCVEGIRDPFEQRARTDAA